jgi:hypothetical protein
VHEIFPIVAGLLLGWFLAMITPRRRLLVGVSLTLVLGATATLMSGEFLIGWEFLLIDVPLVGGCALAGLTIARLARRRRAATDR